MCTMIVQQVEIEGSGKGAGGWFALRQVNVSYDHPFHAPLEHALNIDFVNETKGVAARVAVELTPDSAMKLVSAIQLALSRGEVATGEELMAEQV